MFFASVLTMRTDPKMNGYTIDWFDRDWGGFWLSRWDQGQRMAVHYSKVFGPPLPVQWRVEVRGEWIRIYGDGVLYFEVQDNTYRSGYVGFFAYPNVTKIELSDVRIGNDYRSLIKK